MKEALELAEKGRLLAPPNPWVGCVIVKNNSIVGRGHTLQPGSSHAEIMALTEAGGKAKNADMYVTLEPCCHWGRTPPCVEKIIQAGVKRVFTAIIDPDHQVKGNGIVKLQENGIQVNIGMLSDEVETQLASYLHHRRTGLPYVILKSAPSIDGRIAAKDNSSQWITDEAAREDAHQIRAYSQAIMIGAGTAVADHPKLTVRSHTHQLSKQPLRVICDTHGKIKPEGPLFDISIAPTMIYTSSQCSKKIVESWQEKGVEVCIVPVTQTGIDLNAVLKDLGAKGVLQLLVEGGAALQSTFLSEGLFQQLVVYYGNCLLGNEGLPMFSNIAVDNIQKAPRLKLVESKVIGTTVKCTYVK